MPKLLTRWTLPSVLALAGLQACASPEVPGPQVGRSGPGAASSLGSAKASPSPALQPTLAPTPASSPGAGPASPPLATATPSPKALALGLPSRLVPPLPLALRRAAGLAAPRGLRLFQADGGASAAAAHAAVQAVVQQQVGLCLFTVEVIEGVLKGALAASLQPGGKITVPDEGQAGLTEAQRKLPEHQLTLTLGLKPDHGLVQVYRGGEANPAQQMAGVRFTSPTQGRLVMRELAPDARGERHWLSLSFDLDAGFAEGELYGEGPGGKRVRARVVFQHRREAGPGQPQFELRSTAHARQPSAPEEEGILNLSANFRDEVGGAAIVGYLPTQFAPLLQGQLVWHPADGSAPAPGNAAPHGFFWDAQGQAVLGPALTAELKALQPDDALTLRPFMADPTLPEDGAPLKEAAFQFPD